MDTTTVPQPRNLPPVVPFGPFEIGVNKSAFCKASLQGFGGSGKTLTAYTIACGIYQKLLMPPASLRPIAFIDSEKGSDFVVDFARRDRVPLVHARTKSFSTLMEGMRSAIDSASVLIIDSISTFWSEMQRTYKYAKVINNLKKRNMTEAQIKEALDSGKYKPRLTMGDWVILKDEWRRFTDLLVDSPLHIIMCGRAKWDYDFVEDEEENVKEIQKTGTSMMAEKELSFEPNLIVEMRHEQKPAPDGRLDARFWDHVAYVLKDRSDTIDGQRFVNPVFDNFLPHFKFLNLGGSHAPIESGKRDTKLFERGSDENIEDIRKRRDILLEEIKGEITAVLPGRSEEDQKAKQEILFSAFKTYSWTAIGDLDLKSLRQGRDAVHTSLEKIKTKLTTPAATKGKGAKK